MLTTAAELWKTWTDAGVLRPQDYDKDISDFVSVGLGGTRTSDIVEALVQARWTPRELLHAIAPAVASFSGMMQDLLALYAKVGARAGTGENLRIRYEFDKSDPLDHMLAHFREQAALASRAARRSATQLVFDGVHAFRGPAQPLASRERAQELIGTHDPRDWPFAQRVPSPATTGDETADLVLARWAAVVNAVVDVLSELGSTTGETSDWLRQNDPARETLEGAVAQAATDFWPMANFAALHALADAVRDGEAEQDIVEQVAAWLDGFWSVEDTKSLVNDVTNLLSLPTWGRRHELYSAWIAAQLDQALGPGRLEFVVVGGVLRFPFKATKLADFVIADGAVELWCEVRSDLADPVGKKRTGGIQPDYRVVQFGADPVVGTLLAVEAKQYLRSSPAQHVEALTDYAAGLPHATVLIVGHGVLGPTVHRRVPVEDRPRTRVFEHVRPDRPVESADFRDEVARLLPPRGLPAHIELRWDPVVHDLDIHVRDADGTVTSWQNTASRHARLDEDAYDGGPELIELASDAEGPFDIEVHLYSPDASSVLQAAPEILLAWRDGSTERLRPDGSSGDPKWWRVTRVEADGRVAASGETVVVTE